MAGASNKGSSGRWRVKMYHLADDGQWADKGTGFCSCTYEEKYRGFAICVESEDADEYFKQYQIVADDIYQQQGATIITWKEPSNEVDLALSFQEEDGCHEIWAQITELQGKVVTDYSGGAATPRSQQSEDDEEGGLNLPEPSVSQLYQIAHLLGISEDAGRLLSLQRKSQVAHAIVNKSPQWMLALLRVFAEMEDLEDEAHLHLIYRIFCGLALLNDAHIFELLVSDECAAAVFGAFEHNPEATVELKHREFVTHAAVFHEIVPVHDKSVLTKIHETFRLEYLKDMVLAPIADDVTIATLNTLLHLNNSYIVMRLQGDKTFLLPLFDLLTGDGVEHEKIEGAVAVLHKMCDLAKNLQLEDRDIFYNSLFSSGRSFFQIFERLLGSCEPLQPQTRVRCLQILSLAVLHRPVNLHSFIVERSSHPKPPPTRVTAACNDTEGSCLSVAAAFRAFARGQQTTAMKAERVVSKEKGSTAEEGMDADASASSSSAEAEPPSILWLLQGMLVCADDASIQAEADGILRTLLNPETMEYRKDKFLSIFYDHYMAWLCLPLVAGAAPAPASLSSDDACVQAGKNYVCEMLSFFVKLHGFRIKYFILRNNVVQKVVLLLHCRQKHIRLSAVRFVRACINMKDEFYNRYLVKNDLLSPVFQAFNRNGVNRDDMLNSAVCEMVEFIRTEKIQSLAIYIIDTCGALFKDVHIVTTFDALRSYYDMALEFQRNRNQFAGTATADDDADKRQANARFKQQLQEDSYFDGDDDSTLPSAEASAAIDGSNVTSSASGIELPTLASSKRSVLVDYDDHDSDSDGCSESSHHHSATNQEGNGKGSNMAIVSGHHTGGHHSAAKRHRADSNGTMSGGGGLSGSSSAGAAANGSHADAASRAATSSGFAPNDDAEPQQKRSKREREREQIRVLHGGPPDI